MGIWDGTCILMVWGIWRLCPREIEEHYYPSYRRTPPQEPLFIQMNLPTVAGLVNHSRHFVDPVTGVHTQMVESYWNRVKTKLKRMKGCDSNQLPGYLDEFMWRERYGRSASEALHNIMQNISDQYPV